MRSFFDGLSVKDDMFAAGDGGGAFMLELPLTAAVSLRLPMLKATLSGRVDGPSGWDRTRDGRICGVVSADAVEHALDHVPEADLDDLGGRAALLNVVTSVLEPDVDSDSNGSPDVYGAALLFETEAALVAGVSVP